MYNGNIVLISPPGAGKGTLATRACAEFNFLNIGAGDILREKRKEDSDLGRFLNEILGTGNLVSNEIVNAVIKSKLETVNQPFILDGYPRTIEQAKCLEETKEVNLVIYLTVSNETLIKRILERGKTSGRKDDSSEEIVLRRIQQYNQETAPLIEYYTTKGILHQIDGELSINEVFELFTKILKNLD